MTRIFLSNERHRWAGSAAAAAAGLWRREARLGANVACAGRQLGHGHCPGLDAALVSVRRRCRLASPIVACLVDLLTVFCSPFFCFFFFFLFLSSHGNGRWPLEASSGPRWGCGTSTGPSASSTRLCASRALWDLASDWRASDLPPLPKFNLQVIIAVAMFSPMDY